MTTVDIGSDSDAVQLREPAAGAAHDAGTDWVPSAGLQPGEDLAQRWVSIEAKPIPRRRRLATALVGALVVALAAALALTVTRLVHYERINSARSSALAAATADAKLLGTFRYQHIAQDLKAMEDNSTPAFAKQYVSAQSNLTKLLTQYKADSIGSVVATAVKSVSPHKAVVLAFVDQAVTNSAVGSSPKSEPSRVILTLVRPGGKWLISNVQIV